MLGPRQGSQVRERARACACACNERLRLRVCSFACLCPFARARVRACIRASVSELLRVRVIVPSDLFYRIASSRLCAPRRCARPPIARRRLAVFIARLAPHVAAARAVAFGATGRLSRAFGRRCHVDVPHGQRGMGLASSASRAHVGGRRRRRHLRHRRRRQHLHLLPGRVGQHRRRCAAGLGGGGWSGGTRGVK